MPSAATGIADRQWAYLEAASVLAHFDISDLRPFGVERGGDPFEPSFVADYSNLMLDASGHRVWTLAAPVRRRALQRLIGSGRLQRALDDNAPSDRDRSPLQRMLRSYLEGTAAALSKQSVDELRATLVVAEWLGQEGEPIVPVPAAGEIRKRIDFENYVALFRDLAGDNFVGRTTELNLLEIHVFSEPLPSKPLVFHGPGGIGKSAVLATFILKHATLDPERRFPIVYLDFDRSAIDPDEPVTFLLDAFSQIAIQFPELRSSAEACRAEWTERIANPNFREDRSIPGDRSSTLRFRLKDRTWFTESFARFAVSVPSGSRPLLFVLDTFEEAQFRSRVLVEDTLALLYDLQGRLPRFRAVLAGRAEVTFPKYPCANVPITLLDVDAAADYLMKTARLDAASARVVAQQLKRSPLILRLAALLLSKSGTPGTGSLQIVVTGWKAILLRKSIESQLYERFLDHIHDDEVRKLAHPGLILRRITPQLILEVLAGYCGLKVKDMPAAENLFERLRREGTLVIDVAKNTVEHRPDLRRLMLEDMAADKKTGVEDLHRLAVSYYERYPTEPGARSEELYHRLMLPSLDRDAVDSRWDDAAVRSLGISVEELPKPAQAYVAARLEFEGVDPSVWVAADQIDWERHAGQIARKHLDDGRYDSALETLRERKKRLTASALYVIEADVLVLLGRADEAFRLLESALDEALVNRRSAPEMDALWARHDMLRSLRSARPGLELNAAQVAQVTEALVDSFSLQELAGILRTRTRSKLEISKFAASGAAYRQTVLAVIVAANSQHWALELVAAARRQNPANPKLAQVGTLLGAGTAIVESDLQETAKSSARFVDVESFRRALGELEGRIARIEIAESGFGASATGFLIGPDLLLTAFHNFERAIRRYERQSSHESVPPVIVRFDMEVGGEQVVRYSVEHRLSSDWLVHFSPSPESFWENVPDVLDFVVLRLEGNAAFDQHSGGIRRGWIDVPADPIAVHPGDDILVLSYPAGEGLKLTTATNGILEVATGGDRLYDTARTEIGSSGAPCFNRDLQLIGMRRAGDELRNRFETVTASSIAAALKSRGAQLSSWASASVSGSASVTVTATGTLVPGQDVSEIAAAFSQAFELSQLERLLKALDRTLYDYVPLNAGPDEIFLALISAAQRQGWIESLIRNARQWSPADAGLYRIAMRAGLTLVSQTDFDAALAQLNAHRVPSDAAPWHSALAVIERRICRVEVALDSGEMVYGTGFLFGPDLLMTSFTVIERIAQSSAPPKNVTLRFDFITSPRDILTSTGYRLASPWAVALSAGEPSLDWSLSSPLESPLGSPIASPIASPLDDANFQAPLDYALLRVQASPGSERGWFRPAEAFELGFIEPLLILGYCENGQLHLAVSPSAWTDQDRSHLFYEQPDQPAAAHLPGAACFSTSWQLVGMRTQLGQAVLMTAVRKRVAAHLPV